MRISDTAKILVNGNIADVFPLFGAFEERKWAKGWNPTLVYPSTESIQHGTTFITPATNSLEVEFLWRVSKFDPQICLIQYTVLTDNRYWTITIVCTSISKQQTEAEITYSYTGFNDLGNQLNKNALEKMYQNRLKDWEEDINKYLASVEQAHFTRN